MYESAFKVRLGAVVRVRASNEDLALTIDLTNRLRGLEDENAVLRRQAAELTRHNESLRMRKILEKHERGYLLGNIGLVEDSSE
jgi:hypothetical protein